MRFVLPDKAPEHIRRQDLLYFPYLRFKGSVFDCDLTGVESKVLDTTHVAVAGGNLPITLGVRPQAMKITPAMDSMTGRFIRVSEKMVDLFRRAKKLANSFSSSAQGELLHTAFIGETISCLYLPAYIHKGQVYDAVLNRPLVAAAALEKRERTTFRYQQSWTPRFLSTLCPRCGSAMDGEHDSLVLVCRNCTTFWHEEGGRFRLLNHSVISDDGSERFSLPFWRIAVQAEGVSLDTLGDFLRQTNQPVVVRPEHDNRGLSLWVPAIKIRPKMLLHLAKSMTISQLRLPEGGQQLVRQLHPVTLPLQEAVQSLKTILAASALNKKRLYPALPAITLRQQGAARLVFLPFHQRGHDLIQAHTAMTIARAVLRCGRTL